MTTVYVDSDACPVKAEAVKVAKRHGFDVIFVANSWMKLPEEWEAKLVVVKDDFDAADNWIVEKVVEFDIVITSDIPLADRVIKLDARVVEPHGRILSKENIGNILATRNLMQGLRESGEITSGSKPFQNEDRSRFLESLERVVQGLKRA